jgi:23S rRNA (guanosine2251-2'-O)-methyltransferase
MYVFGKNVAKELISNKKTIKKAFLLDNMMDSDIKKELENMNVNITYLKKFEMDKMEKGNHQGVILDIPDFKYLDENYMLNNMSDNPFIVILDHIEDPHNFGAIIRTCEAAGVDYILLPKNRSVHVNSTVMKTSVGALDNVKIVEITNINNTIKKLKDKGVWIVGTDMEDSVDYDSIDYRYPTALIIGSEGFGMSQLVKKNCDYIAAIPMQGKINSLNASVAAGIMIYEVLRQRR